MSLSVPSIFLQGSTTLADCLIVSAINLLSGQALSAHYLNAILTVIPDRRAAILDKPFGFLAGCEVLRPVNATVEREVEAGFSFGFSSHNFDPFKIGSCCLFLLLLSSSGVTR